MRAVVYAQNGDASVMQVVERPLEEPAEGEVRVRVAVSGVNPTDWKTRSGAFGRSPAEPTVPNHDGAGSIDAVGPGVEGFAAGDRVWMTLAADGRPASGTAQEHTVVPAERVFPLPDGADFELGASLGIPGATAHRALTVAEDLPPRLRPGALQDRAVLVAGGAGAVGNAAIQLARWAGATVIATASGEAKAELAGRAGAHHVVNYRDADAAEQIRSIAPRTTAGPRSLSTCAPTWGSTPGTSSSCSTPSAGTGSRTPPPISTTRSATVRSGSAIRRACPSTASASPTRPPLTTQSSAGPSARSSSRSSPRTTEFPHSGRLFAPGLTTERSGSPTV